MFWKSIDFLVLKPTKIVFTFVSLACVAGENGEGEGEQGTGEKWGTGG